MRTLSTFDSIRMRYEGVMVQRLQDALQTGLPVSVTITRAINRDETIATVEIGPNRTQGKLWIMKHAMSSEALFKKDSWVAWTALLVHEVMEQIPQDFDTE